ncbi:hypothetical protein Nepgr_010935 [Nepenthes gracilis]|uniref:Uncharacterized protein n=1 Tax=Nepenthes gracilis TaxID=150966 RepID=A0AAD3SD72_NEPGR|nr:hypothetical protein Nepgr_010935 [Nepenthes gracilis]
MGGRRDVVGERRRAVGLPSRGKIAGERRRAVGLLPRGKIAGERRRAVGLLSHDALLIIKINFVEDICIHKICRNLGHPLHLLEVELFTISEFAEFSMTLSLEVGGTMQGREVVLHPHDAPVIFSIVFGYGTFI